MPSRAQRMLRKLLNTGKKSSASRQKSANSESVNTTTLSGQRPYQRKLPRSSIVTESLSKQRYALLWLIRTTLVVCLLLLCLIVFVGCAGNTPAATQILVCRVPANLLEPTSVPPMSDETVFQVVMEATELRNALHHANLDKQLAREFTEKNCNDKDR